MPKGVYKRKAKAKADTSTARDALTDRNHNERGMSFTPVMVKDRGEIIRRQERRIAELESEVKRLRQLLHVAVNGTT